jgi:hypothetical protein
LVKKELLKLEKYPGLLCKGDWSCDPYYYLLGLSSELAGDENGAIDAYLRIWWDYSISPYTTIARLKMLGEAALPSQTPTSTQTGSPIATGTPTVTGTPPTSTLTPTGTNTPDPNTTPTETPTPTVTPATPYP